jgi:cobalt/nickel transport system permease protein
VLLFAVHISDGVLAWPWLIGGFAIAAALAVLGSLRLREEEIPRIAVLSAAFFVASLIHVRVGIGSVHLLLNGLVGVILGPRATLAILTGLVLQTLLFSHGGLGTLGVNTVIISVPALAAGAVWRAPWVLRLLNRPGWRWLVGFLLGALTVGATALLNTLVLLLGGIEEWDALAYTVLLLHLPVAAIEGIILGSTVSFLARVKPEMLGLQTPPPVRIDKETRRQGDKETG